MNNKKLNIFTIGSLISFQFSFPEYKFNYISNINDGFSIYDVEKCEIKENTVNCYLNFLGNCTKESALPKSIFNLIKKSKSLYSFINFFDSVFFQLYFECIEQIGKNTPNKSLNNFNYLNSEKISPIIDFNVKNYNLNNISRIASSFLKVFTIVEDCINISKISQNIFNIKSIGKKINVFETIIIKFYINAKKFFTKDFFKKMFNLQEWIKKNLSFLNKVLLIIETKNFTNNLKCIFLTFNFFTTSDCKNRIIINLLQISNEHKEKILENL